MTKKIINPLIEKMIRFVSLGEEVAPNGTLLYGCAPHIGKKAFLHTLYPPLKENEILMLEKNIGIKLPPHLIDFYQECNGFHYFLDTLSVDGLRIGAGRSGADYYQPYDLKTINVDERISDAEVDCVFFGGYDWDGSLVYTRQNEADVYLCSVDSAKPIYSWPSISDFIHSESERIAGLFSLDGMQFDEEKSTLPK